MVPYSRQDGSFSNQWFDCDVGIYDYTLEDGNLFYPVTRTFSEFDLVAEYDDGSSGDSQ